MHYTFKNSTPKALENAQKLSVFANNDSQRLSNFLQTH